ncbi:hypothetical protein JL193_10275 [Polaribacter batillariae]|uniref:Lipocalin-like domain-containing protein n=1 Tax=Polaribacter batillariae TaxID=2808900 RepID=A0ABX7SSV9_9FLAO|nr:hypothetical protein [Polaribacter batillariae]QTD36533.1 hypothetical protein JL193_10275 [Polaribacter batillariae]
MKPNFRFLTVFIFAITLFSCENNQEITIDSNNLLLGSWIEPDFDGENTTFKRGNALPKESYGISFQKNNEFIERTSGWCGTPPLTFFNNKGTWRLNKNLIEVNIQSYPSNFGWKIIELTETKLVVKREVTEQEKDYRQLMDLFNEIETLSRNESCANSNDWKYVAYGAKACGGPQGFMPYSTKINTVDFLQKVANYTNAEKEYNTKWNIVSDCSLPNEPKSIECKNGTPILKY